MNKDKVIYISGKITGMEEEAKVLFAEATKKFTDNGYKVMNPFDLDDNHDKTWESYMKVCLDALERCDIIYMLSNWRDSKGAIEEFILATGLGLPVIYEVKPKF